MNDFVNSLLEAREYLRGQDNIKVSSVSSGGVVKIVFDGKKTTVRDCAMFMQMCGIKKFEFDTDIFSNSIFVTIKP